MVLGGDIRHSKRKALRKKLEGQILLSNHSQDGRLSVIQLAENLEDKVLEKTRRSGIVFKIRNKLKLRQK